MSIADYRRAMEAGDLEGVIATMAPDVVLNSPVTMRHQFSGTDELREVYGAVLAEVSEIVFDREVSDGSLSILFGRGVVAWPGDRGDGPDPARRGGPDL